MSSKLSFGPPGDQWHYERSTKSYDLTRGVSGGSFKLSTSQGPADTSLTVSPSLSALVVVDMQNFFLHPSLRDHPTGLAAIEPTIRVVKKCREAGIQVVWLNWGLTDEDLAVMPASLQRGFARALIAGEARPSGLGTDLGEGKGRILVADQWNTEVYGPLREAAVAEGDVHCAKNRMSGLWSPEQPLRRYLESEGKRTLFFTGVNTDQCVLGTLTDAYSNGWDCVLVEDCCGTPTPCGREVSLHNSSAGYGFVVDSAGFEAGVLA